LRTLVSSTETGADSYCPLRQVRLIIDTNLWSVDRIDHVKADLLYQMSEPVGAAFNYANFYEETLDYSMVVGEITVF